MSIVRLPAGTPPSGDAIAQAATIALTAPGFERRPGYCQRWVRQVVEALYGDEFDQYWRGTAYETMRAFRDSVYFLPAQNSADVWTPLQRGDLVYKGRITSGRAGHVGIPILGNRFAENSSCHWSEADPDARGTRSIAAWGPYEGIVRLSLGAIHTGEGASHGAAK